jgi:site-specific DNA recombinase
MSTKDAEAKRPVRCAIYTRKSSDDGLELDFNSLDAQREAAEAFIASQRGEGWQVIPTHYDDGGFSGGNMDRPALAALLKDVEAGLVDCVVVYKVDRLSRSLLDFTRIIATFEAHKAAFVSVTQHFNTTHSMGRLTLNILLSFAQFEREIISERTRDKIAASRRRGIWGGGRPILGYDVERSPGGSKLLVNPEEAERVRAIFAMYLELGSISRVLRRLDGLGWRNKAWTGKDGREMGGRAFDKSQLFNLLTNPAYIGKVRHKDDLYDGLHTAIITVDLFSRVSAAMRENRTSEGRGASNTRSALLRGLVRCKACGCGMTHHYTSSTGKESEKREYRYYVCTRAQKRGWDACPGPSLPAAELERFVVEQIRAFGRDHPTTAASVRAAQTRLRERAHALRAQREAESAQTAALTAEARRLHEGERSPEIEATLSRLREEIRASKAEAARLEAQAAAIDSRLLDTDELAGVVEAFDPLWQSLRHEERERLVRLLVKSIEYDAACESVSIAFRSDEAPAATEAM